MVRRACATVRRAPFSQPLLLPTDFPPTWRLLLRLRRHNFLLGIRLRFPKPPQQRTLSDPTHLQSPSHSRSSRDLPREIRRQSPTRQLLLERTLVASCRGLVHERHRP